MTRPLLFLCPALLGLLTLCGCGDAPARVTYRRAGAPARRTVALPQTSAPPSGNDALAAPDPLAEGATIKAADPLASGDALGSGPAMPTEHSHWLSLTQYDARVTVRLNGVWYGDFHGSALRDITMRLRPGPNTLSVAYTPASDRSWVSVHVTEGERQTPTPDLVTFAVSPKEQARLRGDLSKLSPTTRTLTFDAK